jgi:hypothetical protein
MCLPSFLSARFLDAASQARLAILVVGAIFCTLLIVPPGDPLSSAVRDIADAGSMAFLGGLSGWGILLQVPSPVPSTTLVGRNRASGMWRHGICVCRPLSWPLLLSTFWRQVSIQHSTSATSQKFEYRLIVYIRQYRKPHSSSAYQLILYIPTTRINYHHNVILQTFPTSRSRLPAADRPAARCPSTRPSVQTTNDCLCQSPKLSGLRTICVRCSRLLRAFCRVLYEYISLGTNFCRRGTESHRIEHPFTRCPSRSAV